MTNVVLKPIMKEYKKLGMSEDEILADMVLAIQNRIMGLSQKERDELGLKNDFLDANNLYEMIRDKHIQFHYNKRSAGNLPTYNISIDVERDGYFMDLPNPYDPNKSYSPYKKDFPRAYAVTPEKIKEMAYQEEWKVDFDERNKQYDNIGLGKYKRELEYLRFHTFKLWDNWIINNGKQAFENASKIIPYWDFNYDDWEEQSQKILAREAALNQVYRLAGDEYETRLYGGLIKDGDQIMKQENILFRYISDNEGGFHAKAYETAKGNGDWTIGHGLSLKKNDTVKKELARLGYNIDDLIDGKTSIKYIDSAFIASKVMEEMYQTVKGEAAKYGVDLTGNRNAYLTIAVVDMAYQGMIGPRFYKALGKYIETGDEKYLGSFDSYTGEDEIIYSSDERYNTIQPTILNELWNDGMANKVKRNMGGIFVRNKSRAEKIEAWNNGQHTNFTHMDFNDTVWKPEAGE